MTLDEFIESEAQRLFAALGERHGRDLEFYRLLTKRFVAPTPEQMQQAADALRRVEEFLGFDPVGIKPRDWDDVPASSKCACRSRRKIKLSKSPPAPHSKLH